MNKIIIILVLAVIIALSVYFFKSGGVSHEELQRTLLEESMKIQSVVDDRYNKLDQKLDRIESKLDRLLEIANRPLPDGMQPAP